MIKYFYLVEFKYQVDDQYKSAFDLGIFSTKKKANQKIESSMNKKGFMDYPKDNFEIIKFGVDFTDEKVDKSKVILYCVYHEYTKEDEEDVTYYTYFDYFSDIDIAKEKLEYLKSHTRIGKKYPDNFEIIENMVDNFNSWSEGFVRDEF